MSGHGLTIAADAYGFGGVRLRILRHTSEEGERYHIAIAPRDCGPASSPPFPMEMVEDAARTLLAAAELVKYLSKDGPGLLDLAKALDNIGDQER